MSIVNGLGQDVRLAFRSLGAAPSAVVRLVLSRVAVLVGIGGAIGSGLSLWASTFVATLLYGLEPRDPITLVGAVATLAVVGVAAGGLPVRRASRIDPARVLRESKCAFYAQWPRRSNDSCR